MKVTIPASSVIDNMTLEVEISGVKLFTARLWLGKKLILLAALVMGCSVKVDTR